MARLFARLSFTTRLVLAAMLITCVIVGINYVVLLELPSRVARDSIEVALRENTQAFNAAIASEREELTDILSSLADRPEVSEAIKDRNITRLESLLTEFGLDDVRVAFVTRGTLDQRSLGVVNVVRAITLEGRTNVVFYREITDEVLNRAEADAGERVAFAVERDGAFIARSKGFSASIRPEDVHVRSEHSAFAMSDIETKEGHRHVYSRRLSQDPSYQLSALSTELLETDALSDTRTDVRNAVIGMTLATVIGLLLIALFTGRYVRQFAERVRQLADGDYRKRLVVRGKDGFADLATSVNILSRDLDQRLGELQESASMFRRTLETLEEGICTWDDDGIITYWNRGAEQLTGIVRERLTNTDPVVVFLRAERAPGVRRVTLPVRRSGGLVVDLVVTTMPDGGIVQTFRDTTMADALQQTQRNFMATAAHQLRTPITTILGFTDTLTNKELDLTDPQREEFLTIIREQAEQLQELAEAFFTNHQLANERVEVTLAPTNLLDAVKTTITRVGRLNEVDETALSELNKHAKIDPELTIYSDRRALIGALTVILENAIKYGAEPITISAERDGGSVVIELHDAGNGIEYHHQARIFDPFYRVDVDMRSGVGGAGLGLFTARKLIEAMHGVIRVRSTPADGTTFTIELPAAAPSDE